MPFTTAAGRIPELLPSPRAGRASAVASRRHGPSLPGAVLAVMIAALVAAGVAPPPALADEPLAEASHAVTVRKGDRGPAVKRIQRKLGVGADGVFGPQTDRALRRFQRRRKDLAADGIVGPKTRRALRLRPFSRDSVVHPPGRGGAPDRDGGGLPNLPPALKRIAECESGGNPRAVSADGRYRGKYQFRRSTWKEHGGRGSDPAEASEAHQDRVALRLYRAHGTAPWPNCGGS